MPTQLDAIIVGAGHNRLICAAYLAKAGRTVLVLERRPIIGGACVTEEVWPGYHVSTASYVMSMMQKRVIEELELRKYGWEVLPTECLFVPFCDGRYFVLWEEMAKTVAEVAKFSRKDAEMYPVFEAFLSDTARFVRDLLWLTPPNPTSRRLRDLKGLLAVGNKFRKLGGKFFRFADLMTMSISDFLDMYFESDPVKAVKAYYGSIGTFLGPKSPGTAYVLLHHLMGDLGGAGGWGFMRGGMGTVTPAIAASAEDHGATIRTEAEVAQILVHNGRTTGVALTSGEERLIELKEVAFTQDAYGPVMVLCCWAKGEVEPLYLVSNMSSADDALYYYKKRFRIETFFSDQKSRGFHIHKSHLSDAQRLLRLLIATCLAYIWVVYLGILCKKDGWQSIIHRGKRCDLSLFQLGIRLLQHFLNEELPIPVQFHITI